ncbi:MAG TPA: hypothetical protein VGS60_07305 [Actinomycetes bacterium]|nr:hypothetical protein [Actinomycetes bacterium]
MSDHLLPGDSAARARYATLTTALGGEPASGFHRAALARLASWTDRDDVDAIAHLIRQAIAGERERADRFRDLLAEVADRLGPSQPSGTEPAYVTLPAVVAATIREAARDTDG